jgi:glutamate synthase (NADPH/NADH) large chain
MTERPGNKGFYRSEFEHDACGIGFVAHIKGRKSHSIIENGLDILRNMSHRGAEGADSKTGDGAGIMIQVPRDFFLMQGYNVPPAGQFATGLVFVPKEETSRDECLKVFKEIIGEEEVRLTAFRDVPVNSEVIGDSPCC